MKKLIPILLLLIACEEDPGPQMGCVTGYNKSDTNKEIVFIYCATYKQYLAGDNVSAGGNDIMKNYTSYKWKAISDCSKCSATWR